MSTTTLGVESLRTYLAKRDGSIATFDEIARDLKLTRLRVWQLAHEAVWAGFVSVSDDALVYTP